MEFISWPDITSFHNVRKLLKEYPHLLGENTALKYRAKVKLHGTNAAVQIRGDEVGAQSRSQLLTAGSNDNAGFAAWVMSQKNLWLRVRGPVTIFGEWCGPGIMKGVAISQIKEKVFAIFAAQVDGGTLIVEPNELNDLFGVPVPGTKVIPWYNKAISIPLLGDEAEVQPILDKINEEVAAVEKCDPWVKSEFDVVGTGEGLVFYPIEKSSRHDFSNFVFKAKGEAHKIVAKAAPVQIDPAVAASIDEFVAMVCTPARLEQGVRSVSNGSDNCDKSKLGPFIGWVCKDIEKETKDELVASSLTWKQVQGAVTTFARNWFIKKSEVL